MDSDKEVKGIIEQDVEGDSPKRLKINKYYFSYFGKVEIKKGDYIEGINSLSSSLFARTVILCFGHSRH